MWDAVLATTPVHRSNNSLSPQTPHLGSRLLMRPAGEMELKAAFRVIHVADPRRESRQPFRGGRRRPRDEGFLLVVRPDDDVVLVVPPKRLRSVIGDACHRGPVADVPYADQFLMVGAPRAV